MPRPLALTCAPRPPGKDAHLSHPHTHTHARTHTTDASAETARVADAPLCRFKRGADREAARAAQDRRVARAKSRGALREYERREEDGRAAFNASLLRANGLGGARDTAAAVLLLRKAASLGVVRAQLALGGLYLRGRGGVAADGDEAFRWFSHAAKQRDADALYELGKCHAAGVGTDRDAAAARWCWRRAARAGHARAAVKLDALEADRARAAAARRAVNAVRRAVARRGPPDAGDAYAPLGDQPDAPLSPLRPSPDARLIDYPPPDDAAAAPPPPVAAPWESPPPPAAVFAGRRRLDAPSPNPFVDDV